jgi:hypothetical protein
MKSIHRSHQNSQTLTYSRTVGQLVLPNQIISSTISCPGCESSLYPAGSLILVTIISIPFKLFQVPQVHQNHSNSMKMHPVARSPRHSKSLSAQLQLRPCGGSLQAAWLLLGGTNPRAEEVPAVGLLGKSCGSCVSKLTRLNCWV